MIGLIFMESFNATRVVRERGWTEAWALGLRCQYDIKRLDENIFDGQRFAVGFETFEIDGDGFAKICHGLVEGVPFGMAAGQDGTRSVVPAIGLGLEYRCVSHECSLADRARGP